MTGQNSEQLPPAIAGATRLKVLLRSVEEIDRELDDIASDAPAARRDLTLDASSLARVDELLASLHGPAVREEFVWSAPPARAEAPSTVPEEAAAVVGPSLPPQTLADISFNPPPAQAAEEDVPRHLLDFEPVAAPGDALVTILDVPDLPPEEPPVLPSAVETVIVAPEGPPVGAQSSLPQVEAPLRFSEPPALPVADFEAAPVASVAAPEAEAAMPEAEAAMPELGAAVESMLIDEEEVVVEAAASTPPEPAEAQAVFDDDEVLVEEAPAAATGTLLGLSPTFRPASAAPSRPPENDLGELVFNLEPELEVAKAPPASSRPLLASSPPLRVRDSVIGAPAPKPPPRSRDSLDNLELDLSDFMHGEARPPSLRPPPLLRQPPPPPARSAPPPVPRASKPRAEAEEIVELDDQEVEVLRASSRPPPGAESKAPPPVPQRPGGQK